MSKQGPLILIGVLALLLVRVVACSSSPRTSAARTPVVCKDGLITISMTDSPDASVISYHNCSAGCVLHVATGAASCLQGGGDSYAPPFHTCSTASDCESASFCPGAGNPSEMALTDARCTSGVCDWRAMTTVSCPNGQSCFNGGCNIPGGSTGAGGGGGSGAGGPGSTSGGFPWNMTGAGGGGGSGAAGTGGTTSGGFPWSMTGAGGGGGSGAAGTGTTSGGFPWNVDAADDVASDSSPADAPSDVGGQ